MKRVDVMPDRIDPITFMRDPQLLDYEPFLGMRAAIKVIYGLKLDSEESDFLAQEHLFGPIAEAPPGGWSPTGYTIALLMLGSRSSKTNVAARLGIYEGATRPWRDLGFILPTELAYITIIAQRQEAADELAKQFIVTGLQDSPELSKMVVEKFGDYGEDTEIGQRRKKDGKRRIKFGSTMRRVLLTNGNAIVARPCNGGATRGYPTPFAILDEMAHWNRLTSTQSLDRDVYRALKPRMAQFGQFKKLMFISTPMGMNGFFWERFERRKDFLDGEVQFTMHAPTRLMNPLIPQSEYEEAKAEDPILYLREWEAHPLDDSLSFIDPLAIDACFNQDKYVAEPSDQRYELMTIDPAFKSDTFAVVIAHFDAGSKRIYIDLVDGLEPKKESGYTRNLFQQVRKSDDLRETSEPKSDRCARQPVIPEVAIAKLSILYQMWHCDEVWTDQMSSSMLLPALKKEGMNAHALHVSSEERRKMYSNLKAIIENDRLRVSGRGTKWVERMRNEMKCLRLTQTPTGALSITKGGGASDDFTDACAHAVYRLFRRYKMQFGAGTSTLKAFAAQRTAGMAVAEEAGSMPMSAGLPFGMTAFGADLFVPGSN